VRAPSTGDVGGHGPVVLGLVLRGPDAPQPVGRSIDVEVAVRNLGTEAVWIVGVVGGSEEGIRYPHYRPAVTRDGAVVAEPAPPEDPLVGPLRVVDFRRLGPGEGFDPTRGEGAAYLPLITFATFQPTEPGAYQYTLTLSTESQDPEEWLGRYNQEAEREAVLDLVARVPRLTVTSPPALVEVR
jgi:hypothetical protein